jgi:hypothetical protein
MAFYPESIEEMETSEMWIFPYEWIYFISVLKPAYLKMADLLFLFRFSFQAVH